MLRWVEAIGSSASLDPSPILLQDGGGTVVHACYLSCQRFSKDSENFSPLQAMSRQKLGQPISTPSSSPISFGRHWSVLKNSGLLQCLVEGRPVTLLSLSDCHSICINNPQTMKEGAEFSVRLYTAEAVFVLRADMPTDHFEWTTAAEWVLRELNCARILCGDKCRESGYVALKRLIMLHKSGVSGMELGPCCRDSSIIQSLYCDTSCRDQPDGCEEHKLTEVVPPLPPRTRDRGSSAPPLPPRDPPPLPPKHSNSLQRGRAPSIISTSSNGSVNFDPDEYIIMQSPRCTSPNHTVTSTSSCSIPSPISEGEDYLAMKPFPPPSFTNTPIQPPRPLPRGRATSLHPPAQRVLFGSPSPPVSIPGTPRPAKRSFLLRTNSESSSISDSTGQTPPVPPHRNASPLHPQRTSHSLSRNCGLYKDRMNSGYPAQLEHPSSPLIQRSNSTVLPPSSNSLQSSSDEMSSSDGLTVNETKQSGCGHQYNHGGSCFSVGSELYDSSTASSSCSSAEDIAQVSLLFSWPSIQLNLAPPLPPPLPPSPPPPVIASRVAEGILPEQQAIFLLQLLHRSEYMGF